jgi:acetylornithine/succinyldiaminopimelate/putrescine aminotransferase
MSVATDIISRENTYEALTYDRYPVVFTHGDGYKLYDTDGKEYIDLYGGHCVSMLGHTPEKVRQAIHDQAGKLFFYSNVAYSPVRADAAERLVKMSPEGFDRVFFCNSGTEANENAIKLAWKITGKTRLVATVGGWHGRTLASLSITDDPKITDPVSFALVPCEKVPFGDAAALEACLKEHDDVAAFVLEPIQSIAGMVSAPDQYYRDIREICDRYGVVLIFDEIQTGVGRTGAFSVSEWYDMKPDLITMAKSLASGMPIGAVIMPERIASTLKNGDLGSTFAGGPVVAAACKATLESIEEQGLMRHAIDIFETLSNAFKGSGVELLGRGALIGLKLPIPYKEVKSDLFSRGWLTGGSSKPDVMRLMPPLITPLSVFERFADDLKSILAEKMP